MSSQRKTNEYIICSALRKIFGLPSNDKTDIEQTLVEIDALPESVLPFRATDCRSIMERVAVVHNVLHSTNSKYLYKLLTQDVGVGVPVLVSDAVIGGAAGLYVVQLIELERESLAEEVHEWVRRMKKPSIIIGSTTGGDAIIAAPVKAFIG